MHKMKIIFSKYFIYPLFFLTFLVLYCFISQVFIAQNQKLRNLAESNLEEICKDNEFYIIIIIKVKNFKLPIKNLEK